MRASRACTKQMATHRLTRSEINLHFASKSHNHIIIPSIEEEQAPGSCFLLGRFAWHDGVRGLDPAWLLLQGTFTLVGLPSVLLVDGLQFSVQWEVLGEAQGCGSSSSPSQPTSPSSLALGLSTLCQGSPVGNTSQSSFPHTLAWHRSNPSPVTPSSYQYESLGWNWGTAGVMLLCALHRSQPASAQSAETGENPTFRAACVAIGSEFLGGLWQSLIISRPWLFAGKGRQRGWVTPHFLPFLEAAHSECDARALITSCFHNTSTGLPPCSVTILPAQLPSPAFPASVSSLSRGGNTALSAARVKVWICFTAGCNEVC